MRKKDQVRDQILNSLLSAHYRFGDPIPVKELCEETGISRQPIMTALAELSSEGFVTVVAQVGCEVASPSREEIDDFYLMFERLEGLMAELAARRRTADHVRRLKTINYQISLLDPEDLDAAEAYRSLNRAFHGLMHEMAQSPLLFERQSNIFTMSDFFIAQTIGFIPHLKGAAEEHEEIIEAITSQDSDRARFAAEKHIHEVGNFVRQGFLQKA